MKWFINCTSLDEVKALYKELAKKHHPDMGGDTATMQEINNEYAFASAKILKGGNLSEENIKEEIKFSEEYQRIIEQISKLEGIIIELVGRWIWVSGNTYPVRKELGAVGLFYAGKKKMWYYRSEEYKALGSSNKTIDQIKEKYGSQTIHSNLRKTLK